MRSGRRDRAIELEARRKALCDTSQRLETHVMNMSDVDPVLRAQRQRILRLTRLGVDLTESMRLSVAAEKLSELESLLERLGPRIAGVPTSIRTDLRLL